MKRILVFVLSLMILTLSSTSVFARGKVSIELNGQPFVSDTEPFIENNRTYVPVRAIFEAVGASVTWDEENKTAIIARMNGTQFKHVALQVGNDYVFINSEKVAVDAPAFIENNRTYVPLAVIMRALGEEVVWDGATSTVKITSDK